MVWRYGWFPLVVCGVDRRSRGGNISRREAKGKGEVRVMVSDSPEGLPAYLTQVEL